MFTVIVNRHAHFVIDDYLRYEFHGFGFVIIICSAISTKFGQHGARFEDHIETFQASNFLNVSLAYTICTYESLANFTLHPFPQNTLTQKMKNEIFPLAYEFLHPWQIFSPQKSKSNTTPHPQPNQKNPRQ